MNIPEAAEKALELLERAGFEAYLVGGCVRDALLGSTPGDWDICSSALPEETKRVFASFRVIETGLRHGTVTVRIDGLSLEITTFRRDGAYTDGRHPDAVSFTASIEEDLARRDFTINAMAMDLRARLIDPYGGQSDLRAGLLRCVGRAEERFREDALRLLRALRFAARYELKVESETAAALFTERDRLACVSVERVFSELCGILTAPGAEDVLREFSPVLFAALPELAPLEGLAQNPATHAFDAWEHTLRTLSAVPGERVLRLAALLHDIGKPRSLVFTDRGARFYAHAEKGAEISDALLRRLHCDNATRLAVTELVALHGTMPAKTLPEARRELAKLGAERTRELYALRRADAIGHGSPRGEERLREAERGLALTQEALSEGIPLSVRELRINGDELRARGLEGRAVGDTLHRLWEDVLDGKIENEHDALLKRLEELR